MIGLCCYETYGAMTNHDDGDDDGDKDRNEYKNYDDNAASVSGYGGPIFDPIAMPQSCRGGLGDDDDGAAAAAPYISTRWNISTL